MILSTFVIALVLGLISFFTILLHYLYIFWSSRKQNYLSPSALSSITVSQLSMLIDIVFVFLIFNVHSDFSLSISLFPQRRVLHFYLQPTPVTHTTSVLTSNFDSSIHLSYCIIPIIYLLCVNTMPYLVWPDTLYATSQGYFS